MPVTWKISLPVTAGWKAINWAFDKLHNYYFKEVKKYNFVFEQYTKHLTVYQDGHGILVNDFLVNILNSENFESFERKLYIRDACIDTAFKPLREMRQVDKRSRFTEMGFWYEPTDLIKDVLPVVNTKKELEWKFLFDKNKIKHEKMRKINISYSVSLPGMFPIQGGYFNPDLSPTRDYIFSSSISVRHKIKSLIYILALEKDIRVAEHPAFKIFPCGEDHACKSVDFEDKSDIFYSRYVAQIKKPLVGSKIQVSWKIADTK